MFHEAIPSYHASALDNLRDWGFSLTSAWEYFSGVAVHHVSEHGFLGLTVVVIVVLTLLICFRPTRYVGSQLTTNLISSLFAVTKLLTVGAAVLATRFASKVGAGGVRNAFRALGDLFKQKD